MWYQISNLFYFSFLQLAALDFIACSAADVFAMTDAGSQFSSLVQGYRMYYGEGKRPSIRPNKRRLASIFARNATIEWKDFEHSVRKAIRQNKKVEERPVARSVYRHPRCAECMCLVEQKHPSTIFFRGKQIYCSEQSRPLVPNC